MFRNAYVFCLLTLTLAGLGGGCSSGPSAKESKKAAPAPDKIQGKAEINMESTAADEAFNAGGPAVYLVDGLRHYRLFFKNAFQAEPGKEYIAEGVYAQRAIDEIGDPDQGKNGYPLQASCERVVSMAWPGMEFDVRDLDTTALCTAVKRYPARPIFLVMRLTPAPTGDGTAAPKKNAKAEDLPEVSVAADKQRALLIAGPTVQTAPLWAPAGGTVHCKLVIDGEGKVSQLETGVQLCESVPWSQFSYKPTLRDGHPVKVSTEVEVRFDPRK